MDPNLRPQLRSHVQRVSDPREPGVGFVVDELRQCPEPLQLPIEEWQSLRWLDGVRTLREIEAACKRRVGGGPLSLERLSLLISRLDEALLLEGPRWRQHVARPVRDPVCIGCYEGDPEALTRQVAELFTGDGGPGLPGPPRKDGDLRAALIPHIDYARGGVSYGWGFKEVFENTNASLFVIIGTSHYSTSRFTLTRKNFKTPLGETPTDQDFIDRLVRHYGDGLFEDELRAHLPEHSIELHQVFLQWFYARRRPIRIVPLVVGSFHDATLLGTSPSKLEDIGRMVQALRRAEAETPEPICYLISGDLAHIGPKFNPHLPPISAKELAHSKRQDEALLKRLENVDTNGYFQIVADEQDERAICGFPPTFTLIDAIQPRRGKMLCYDRYVHPLGFESVSFASMAFYR
jgi:MEMO1 family protein